MFVHACLCTPLRVIHRKKDDKVKVEESEVYRQSKQALIVSAGVCCNLSGVFCEVRSGSSRTTVTENSSAVASRASTESTDY